MRPSLRVLLVFGGFVATVVAASVLPGLPRHQLGSDATDADHVVLYQNGLAAVTLGRSFDSTGGDQVLVFHLPTTTVFDSIQLEGAAVKQFRSSLAQDPVLDPGDQVVLVVEDGSRYEGTLLSQDGGQVMLETSDGSVIVPASRVTAYEVPGRSVSPAGPGATELLAVVSAPPGNTTVTLSYIAQGPRWNPNHIFDVETGDWTFFATLTGLYDWRDVSLDLVAGAPNLVLSPRASMVAAAPPSAEAAGAGADYDVGFSGGSELGDLYRFSYHERVDLERGQSIRLPLVAGDVEIVRHYYDFRLSPNEQKLSGMDTYHIRNTLGEAIPGGTVQMYIGNDWIGSDSAGAVGRGEHTNLTAARSTDVKAQVTQTDFQQRQTGTDERSRPTGTDTRTLRVTVSNFKAESTVEYHAVMDVGTFRTRITQSSGAEVLEGRLTWDGELAAGDDDAFTVVYEQDWTR